MKYKVGDKVRVINDNGEYQGEKGVIEVRDSTCYPYRVSFDKGGSDIYDGSHLELVSPTLEDMTVGTVLVCEGLDDREVVFVLKPGLYVLSHDGYGVYLYTGEKLKEMGFEIKDEESEDVEITVEGNTKTISRKSAKELNLID